LIRILRIQSSETPAYGTFEKKICVAHARTEKERKLNTKKQIREVKNRR
jgi:hypothetical protein